MNTKFGLAIPTYKRASLVTRAIDSILNQTYNNFLICIVEDCSPDNTQDVLQQYKNNKQIKYIRLNQNSGVNKARNTAIDYLIDKVDYISFLDDDDYFSKDTLKEANNQISEIKCDWLVFNRVYSNGNKITQCIQYNQYYSYLYDHYLDNKISGDTCMFIAKKAINKYRFFDNIRAREYLFYILISVENQMYMVDFDAIVCEYLEDGLTNGQYQETKIELEQVYKTEEFVLNKHNLKRQQLICKNILNQLSKSIKKINLDRVIRYIIKYVKFCLLKLQTEI
jgi:glycosyltransferase involved in cell wall biosynthesis